MAAHLQQFPAELLGEIFMACVMPLGHDSFHTRLSPPWSLARVCKRWNSVAITTQRLWCKFTLFIHNTGEKKSNDANCNLLSIYLQRSSSQPLSIFLSYEEKVERESECCPILDLLTQQSFRWELATIRLLNPHSLDKMQSSLVPGNLPILKSLVIHLPSNAQLACSAFEISPQLRSLTLNQLCSPVTRPRMPQERSSPLPQMPWGQLTHFTAHKMEFINIRSVLRSMSALTELVLIDSFGMVDSLDPDGSAALAPIYLPNLTTLVMTGMRHLHRPQQEILQYIKTPALRDLWVGVRGLPSFQQCMLPLISRSSCRLRKLSIVVPSGWQNSEVPEDEIITVLQQIPTLEELEIQSFYSISNNFLIHFLTRDVARPQIYLCPNLKSFTLEGPWDDHERHMLGTMGGAQLNVSEKDVIHNSYITHPYVGLRWEAPFELKKFTSLQHSEMTFRGETAFNYGVQWTRSLRDFPYYCSDSSCYW